jgi:hypothetical protein
MERWNKVYADIVREVKGTKWSVGVMGKATANQTGT